MDAAQIDSLTGKTEDVVRHLLALPDSQRDIAASVWIKSRQRHHVRLATHVARKWGAPSSHIDDVACMFDRAVFTVLAAADRATGSLREQIITSFETRVFSAARDEAKTYLAATRHSMSGMVDADRRHHKVRRAREILTVELGREPTTDEVLARAQASNNRSDSSRERPFDESDLTPPQVCDSLDALADALGGDASMDFAATDAGADCLLHPAETPAFLAEVCDECDRMDGYLGRAARMWVSMAAESADTLDRQPTHRLLAHFMGCTEPQARDLMAMIHQVASDVAKRLGYASASVREAVSVPAP